MASLCRCLRSAASLKLLQSQPVCAAAVQKRWLNLHEYQSKELMDSHGLAVQRFLMAEKGGAEAEVIAKKLNPIEFVIKAQILAGGRGKGTFDNGFKGGVKLTKDPKEVGDFVSNMVGHRLMTKQTPPEGVLVQKVMIAEAFDIEDGKERYLAILMDRESNGPVIVGSPYGGMDIEEVAENNPEAIFKEPVDIMTGITDEIAERMATNLLFEGDNHKQAVDQIKKMYNMFIQIDATQIEVNPIAETTQGKVICFDAKINFDDSARFRQKKFFDAEDKSEMDWREREANESDLNYIGMDGNIACLVNGAGLAMATMDIIKLKGGEPANFLDVGGGVTESMVENAFKLITKDSQVKAILVNIFGGIVNCKTIAEGITNAAKSIHLQVPLVVRLEGTNVDEARKILDASGMKIISATDLGDAAEKAVGSIA
ncbi:succinate--CoA ligase [GDP-forming] subunit beta, mitochondrial-like [Lingula anatina]|uniref:Succinate--CoA ligase [GDP-forming] subunit beta, mitochondrial n=1 Tax=Lingula anatina TaxID=7574 RepID=A0A1S3I509_LINAN|nr:succinate--CoA ligase [GDP-forming] subunit beta, mitochondrial-like [Lingula anatina]|eukprot:XP_013393355.1 succinate--CoA ligase [GDP-forming] subunit beta, mitochondrial-like [Lingula anatina]